VFYSIVWLIAASTIGLPPHSTDVVSVFMSNSHQLLGALCVF
jgi:hypothetical protein